MKKCMTLAAGVAGLLAASMLTSPTFARVIDFKIQSSGPVFDGQSYGNAGTYERIDAVATIAVDPKAPENAVIVGIDKAPTDENGDVVFSTEVSILRPSEAAKRSPFLFYEIVNRGRNLAFSALDGAHSNSIPSSAEDAGDGFLPAHGDTIVWNGWQPHLADKLMNIDLPVEKGVTGMSREQAIFDKAGETGTIKLTYPAADLDPAKATLTVRTDDADKAETPKGLTFKYVSPSEIEITRPADAPAGAIYEFVYPAKDPVPAGLGMAAIRDVVSFLRGNPGHDAKSPVDGIKYTVGMGISQSGRLMRDLIYQGFNADEGGKRVFDGAMIHIAGSRKTFVNYAFAQPGRYSRQHEDHDFPGDQFPFTYVKTTDAISGKTDGILEKCQETKTCPKIMHSDSSTEFWQARGYLLTTSTDGKSALTMPDNVRLYLIAGTQHFSLWDAKPATKEQAAYPTNPLSATPVLRALYDDMEAWVADGTEPPASRYPNLTDGTLAAPADLAYPEIAGTPMKPKYNVLQAMDYATLPPTRGKAYPELVPTIDADGNPQGGVTLPRLAAPLGTYEGWNLRTKGYAEGELYSTTGSFIAFPATPADDDSRDALAERYESTDAYLAQVKAAAEELVADRLMREEDVAKTLEYAKRDAEALQ